jgi:hypothetical protein
MTNRQETLLRSNIEHYFGFLFSNGYNIRELHFLTAFGDWQVILESETHLIKLYTDRGSIGLEFLPEKTNLHYGIDFGTLIYYLSQRKVFFGYYEGNPRRDKKKQLQRISGTLKEYHARITSFLNTDLATHQAELESAKRKYVELLQQQVSQWL